MRTGVHKPEIKHCASRSSAFLDADERCRALTRGTSGLAPDVSLPTGCCRTVHVQPCGIRGASADDCGARVSMADTHAVGSSLGTEP